MNINRLIALLVAKGTIETPPPNIRCRTYDIMIETSNGTGWTPPTLAQLETVMDEAKLIEGKARARILIEDKAREARVVGLDNNIAIDALLGLYSTTDKTKMKNFVQNIKTEYARLKSEIDSATTIDGINNIINSISFPTTWDV